MTLKSVPLASLLPPKGNPRRTVDDAQVAALARSIKSDGLLQNLVVRPDHNRFRVISGKRRYLALQLLRKEKHIDGQYRVPVEVKKDLAEDDALRIATIENVQREQMHPLDEADAFASLLQRGGTVEAIAEKSGLTEQLVKRRLALAGLCSASRRALLSGAIGVQVAEALTIGTPKQQESVLEAIEAGDQVDAGDVRHMLLNGKPTVAMAIFPKEKYAGSYTTDLFAEDETTYFDDVDQFLILQREAVEQLAEEHRKTAGWVEVLNLYTAPWWQYRDAKKKERAMAGVVINLHPSGAVEVREGLIKHEVQPETVVETRETVLAPKPKERAAFSAAFLRCVANLKSVAVQAAVLRDRRKAKQLAVVLLLAGNAFRSGVRMVQHGAIRQLLAAGFRPPAYAELEAAAAALADKLGLPLANTEGSDGISRLVDCDIVDIEAYDRLGSLADGDLDELLLVLVVLCFGQDNTDALDVQPSLFNHVAQALDVGMRNWWTPDRAFLAMLRRDQLQMVAESCGGPTRFTGFKSWSKTELVEALARFFEPSQSADQPEQAGAGAWLPGPMRFPATTDLG